MKKLKMEDIFKLIDPDDLKNGPVKIKAEDLGLTPDDMKELVQDAVDNDPRFVFMGSNYSKKVS